MSLVRFLLLTLLLTGLARAETSAPPSPTTTTWESFAEIPIPARLQMPDPAAADILTRETAIRLALANSPVLRAAHERLEMARAEARQKSAASNLLLSAGASLVPHPVDDENAPRSQFFDTDFTYVSYVFPTSGRRLYNTRSAQGRLLAATEDLRTAELDLVQNVVQAYADLQVSTESIAVHEDNYRIALAFTDFARRQFQAGAVPETNIIRTQIEGARTEQELRKAHADRRVKEEVLGLHVARPAGQRIGAADPLEANPHEPPADLPTLRLRAVESRPEIVGAQAALASLEAEVDVARSARRPDLTVEAAFTDRITNSGAQPFRAFVQLPLWDRGQIGGNVARARAEVRAAAALLEQLRRQISTDVGKSYHQVESARAVLQALSRDVLPQTRTLLERARVAYLAGAGTLLDLLDAQRVYRQAALDTVGAQGELARSLAALDRAAGNPLSPTPSPRRTTNPR